MRGVAVHLIILLFCFQAFAGLNGSVDTGTSSGLPQGQINTAQPISSTNANAAVNCDQLNRAPNMSSFFNACLMCRSGDQVNCAGAALTNYCLAKKCSPSSGCRNSTACRAPAEDEEPDVSDQSGSDPKATARVGGAVPKTNTAKPSFSSANNKAANSSSAPAATGNAQSDVQTCQSMQSQARNACRQTSSQAGTSLAQIAAAGGSEESMINYCRQQQAAGTLGEQTSASSGTACYQRASACETTCSNYARNYQGSDSSAANALNSISRACSDLSNRAADLGNQGLNSGQAASESRRCQELMAAKTQSMTPNLSGMGGGSAGSPSNGFDPNDPYGCSSDPSSTTCQNLAAQESQALGEGGFASREKDDGSDKFNIPDTSTDTGGGFKGNAIEAKGTTNGTVANNAGGAIPGSGSSGAGAKMDAARGPSPGSPGYTTDVLTGFNSGSGYAAANGGVGGEDDGGNGGAYGNGRMPANERDGLDLRRYLPGGDKDPKRRGLGGLDIYAAQINGKSVDIWSRISVRMQEKCRLGELIGCN